MKCFGLTGGIGAGKSEAVQLLREKGITVIDADELAHKVTAPGTPGLTAVINRFGTEFLTSAHELDRKKLGAHIFSNRTARKDLEQIVHPLINQERERILLELKEKGEQFCIISAPLIFENNLQNKFDATILIVADFNLRVFRIMKRDNLPSSEILKRINAQMSDGEKIKLATAVIYNNGSREELAHNLSENLKHLTGIDMNHM